MRTTTLLISGLFWGLLGSFVAREAFGTFPWFSVAIDFSLAAFAGILIGTLIYGISRWTYRLSAWSLIPLSIVTTIIAVGLFGLALGIGDLARGMPGRTASGVVMQSFLACLWGLVFSPACWGLFPLAWGNHAVLRRIDRRAQAKAHAPGTRAA